MEAAAAEAASTPSTRFRAGDIETADIALSAADASELVARQEATVPEPDAASAIVDQTPNTPEPRDTIEGVEIERPVWTFTPQGVRSVPAVPLPAEPAAPAEPSAPPPVLEDVERSRDVDVWESSGSGRQESHDGEKLEIERGSLAEPAPWSLANGAAGARPGAGPAEAAPRSHAVEDDVVTQEVDVVQGAAPAKEPEAAPDVAAPPGDRNVAEVFVPSAGAARTEDREERAYAARATSSESPEDDAAEAWSAATRPAAGGEQGDAKPGVDSTEPPAQEAARKRPTAPEWNSDSGHADDAARELDEMTAALGWPDTGAGSHAGSAVESSAELPALDAELRTTAALFAASSDVSPGGDVAAALERIARRIREGEVVLPRDAGAASEESALAVTLAALLNGPPRG